MQRLIPLLLLLAACGGEAMTREQAETRAAQATSALMKTLLGEMMQAMQSGKPEQALHVCAEVAQDITARVGKEQGVNIRRTALKVRNPKNAPDAYEQQWMENAVKAGKTVGTSAEVVDGELRYVRPIYLGKLCVACHGTALSEPVKAALNQHYPNDQATGFRPNDFRGIVSVRIPVKE